MFSSIFLFNGLDIFFSILDSKNMKMNWLEVAMLLLHSFWRICFFLCLVFHLLELINFYKNPSKIRLLSKFTGTLIFSFYQNSLKLLFLAELNRDSNIHKVELFNTL